MCVYVCGAIKPSKIVWHVQCMLTNSLEIIILHCLETQSTRVSSYFDGIEFAHFIHLVYTLHTHTHVSHQNAVISIKITIIRDDIFNAGYIWIEFIMRSAHVNGQSFSLSFSLSWLAHFVACTLVLICGFRYSTFSCAVESARKGKC